MRPWALATPIAVLLVCLPLLRPLRHPGQVSTDEELRLATIAALAEHQRGWTVPLADRLAIDERLFAADSHLIRVNGRLYSDQPPMLAFLLSAPYRILHRMGYPLRDYSVLVPYLLTLIGSTLPAAAAGGLVYRMGRTFELARPWRAALAAAVVFGSGLVSYAVVLNPTVAAAALVLGSMGSLLHLAASDRPSRGGGWLVIAGFCAALAATIDPWACVFLLMLLIVIPAMRLPMSLRFGGVILYLLGAAPPILLHATLTVPLTGNLLPGYMHPELEVAAPRGVETAAAPIAEDDSNLDIGDEDDNGAGPSLWTSFWRGFDRLGMALFGQHGLLVHFPVVVVGFGGMLAVMHRHWPTTTKLLAAVSAAALLIALLGYAASGRDASAGFANRDLIVFSPILFFWTGAWLRRSHHAAVWWIAGILLAFSIAVSLIGATDPLPRDGYDRYTVAGALHNLFYPAGPTRTTAWAQP
ncbi:MAG: hypothetical protein ABSF29_06895 [Tepidisphaeraceae bacterium]